MFSIIRAALIAKCRTLEGTGQPIAEVHDHIPLAIDKFPAVMVIPQGYQLVKYEDTSHNVRAYTFNVAVVQENVTAGKGAAFDNLVTVVDAITEVFDEDFTLGGLVNKGLKASSAEIEEREVNDGSAYIASMTVNAEVLQDIYN